MRWVRSHPDIWAGIPLVAVGALGFYFSRGSGSSLDLTENLFPRVVGISLIATGVAITLRGLFASDKAFAGFPLRSCATITGGVVAFAILVERAGLALAVMAVVLLSSFGFRGSRLGASLVFGSVMVAAMYVLFVGILGQPMKFAVGF